jgi:hypothetical protein
MHDATEFLSILKGKEPIIDQVLANPEKYHLQIHFTSVNEQAGGMVLNEYSLYKDKYYYHPASLIKFPLALISLEMFTRFQKQFGISLQTPIESKTCSCDFDTDNYVNHKSKPSLDILYREMLIMSNNDAYNFFYDFVGPTHFNKRMRELSLSNIILRNRFSSGCSGDKAKLHGGISFIKDNTNIRYAILCQTDSVQNSIQNIYMKEVGAQSYNLASLYSLHQLMKQLFYPTTTNQVASLKISEANLNYFKQTIASYPKSIPDYHSYPNHYHKYLIPPGLINNNDSTIKVYSKNGNAGGYLSDIMYFTDEKNKVNYFLSVSMYNATNKYYYKRRAYYSSPGIDFFRQLSKVLYNYEKEKKIIKQ